MPKQQSQSISVEQIHQLAQANPQQVAVCGANNEDALEAVQMALGDGVVSGGFLIGDQAAIEKMSAQIGLNISKFEIISTENDEASAHHGARLVAEKKAGLMLKGQLDTKIYMRAILDKQYGLMEPGATLTHLGIFTLPTYHKLLIGTDAAILIAPSVEEKAKMIDNAVRVAKQLGVAQPKVALIAAVEKVNPKMQSTVDSSELVKMAAAGRFGEAIVEGPYDMYIATSEEGARIKGINGQVAGDADILVFPGIDAANVFYKSVNCFVTGACSAGLIGGARIPILLPSRADDAKTKRMSILFAAYLSGKK